MPCQLLRKCRNKLYHKSTTDRSNEVRALRSSEDRPIDGVKQPCQNQLDPSRPETPAYDSLTNDGGRTNTQWWHTEPRILEAYSVAWQKRKKTTKINRICNEISISYAHRQWTEQLSNSHLLIDWDRCSCRRQCDSHNVHWSMSTCHCQQHRIFRYPGQSVISRDDSKTFCSPHCNNTKQFLLATADHYSGKIMSRFLHSMPLPKEETSSELRTQMQTHSNNTVINNRLRFVTGRHSACKRLPNVN